MKGVARLSFLLAAVGCAPPRSAPTPSPASSPSAPVSSVQGPAGSLSVDDGGRGGLPVLLVHGNGSNKSQWGEQLAHLRATRRAAALDLRGMGQSAPAADGDYSVEAFAADVAAVADALKFSRFVLVGHSFGGAVVGAYAGCHPERLAGLVFADVAGDLSGTPGDQIEGLRRGLDPANYVPFTDAWFDTVLAGAADSTRAAVLASLHATPREVFVGATLGLYSFHLKEALARYAGPTLSVTSYLAENPLAIHRSIPRVPVRVIAGASHWLMMDKPEQFDRILDEFLAGLEK